MQRLRRAELFRPLRRRFKEPAALDRPLERLEQHGYLLPHTADRVGSSRKGEWWQANPRWCREDAAA